MKVLCTILLLVITIMTSSGQDSPPQTKLVSPRELQKQIDSIKEVLGGCFYLLMQHDRELDSLITMNEQMADIMVILSDKNDSLSRRIDSLDKYTLHMTTDRTYPLPIDQNIYQIGSWIAGSDTSQMIKPSIKKK